MRISRLCSTGFAILALWSALGHAGPAVNREVTVGLHASLAHSSSAQNGSVAHVECILSRLQTSFSVHRIPWRRARQEVLKGTIDGYFTAMPRADVDHFAVLSEPLVLENWYWFWRGDREPFILGTGNPPRLGAILGSHQASVLTDQGYKLHAQVNSLAQLIKLMASGRIDGLVADKEHFEEAAEALGVTPDQYQFRFFRYVPLGVYFGKSFVAQHPDFLPRFNRNIYPCAPEHFALSAFEREKIEGLIRPILAAWREEPKLQGAVLEQNRRHEAITMTDILAWDSLWMDEFRHGSPKFSLEVLNNTLSKELRVLKHATAGLVTEVIVMDEHGLNVGVSAITSDYWQGNEDKYQQVFGFPPEHMFIDMLGYDESTRRFQVQVSVPLYNIEQNSAIGVITVGVDVERALAKSW